VQTQHLVSFLSPFSGEYHLQWIDDNSCLAVFKDPGKMLRALAQLKGGIFKVKAYAPEAPPLPASQKGVVVLGSSGAMTSPGGGATAPGDGASTSSSAPLRKSQQLQQASASSSSSAKKPWEMDANPFAALHGTDADAPTSVRKSKWNETNDRSALNRTPSPPPAPANNNAANTSLQQDDVAVPDDWSALELSSDAVTPPAGASSSSEPASE
jgi:hypothetical protein